VRLLMLGWEFPPFISGGLGTACYGLVRAMERLRMETLFVLPMAIGDQGIGESPWATIRRRREGAGLRAQGRHVRFQAAASAITNPYPSTGRPGTRAPGARLAGPLAPVVSPSARRPAVRLVGAGALGGYEGDLSGRIREYADRCVRLTRYERFDVVHAHDWMTFPAGASIAARSGKPLVVHVHATEFDRSGEHVNQALYEVERRGMEAATTVIAVSHRTKGIIVQRYGVPASKVRVIHNGIEPIAGDGAIALRNGSPTKKVLFLGRITGQKGPAFFVEAAARVARRLNNVRFIVAGWGDLGPQLVEQVAALGLGSRVHFAGFLRGADVQRAYQMADVYVMPSVSEPFGLTVLEAIQHRVPVIVSKTSGVAEVLPAGALKCDFWDTRKMASQIVAVLNRPELAESLRRQAMEEIRPLTWDAAARKCREVYREALRRARRHARIMRG